MYLHQGNSGGIYIKRSPGELTITWHRLTEYQQTAPNTIQLSLRDDGMMRFSYHELNPRLPRVLVSRLIQVHTEARIPSDMDRGELPPFAPRLIGIHPGGDAPLETIDFKRGLPYSSSSPTVLFQDYDEIYAQYMHERMEPLALILLIAAIFVVAIFPVIFRRSVTNPIRSLYEGMHRARAGDPNVVVPYGYNDEIGYLIETFNHMLGAIREAEAEMRIKQHQLLQADKLSSLGVLVATVAHEINNPNQIILTNAELLKRSTNEISVILEECAQYDRGTLMGGLDIEESRKLLPKSAASIEECSKRIQAIAQDLKAFVRTESASDMVLLDVNQTIQTAVELFSSYIKKHSNNFSLQLAKKLPPVRGSRQRIEQVFINLILNACQAIPDPNCAIAVASRFDPLKKMIVIDVIDKGSGIPVEVLSRVREPLYSTKRTRGGTGLGLSVSESIIKAHSGTLEIVSEQGKGTIVSVCLPAEEIAR